MAETEYKKFDSQDKYEIHHARLTKNATITPGTKGDMVRLTFVSTCKSDRYSDLWAEANVCDYNADAGAFMEKGDILGIRGKPGLRRYGDDNEKVSFEILRAELMIPPELFKKLKERGWVPGAKKEGKPGLAGKKNPAKGATTKPAKKVIEIPDDPDDDAPDDDAGEE